MITVQRALDRKDPGAHTKDRELALFAGNRYPELQNAKTARPNGT